MKAPEVWHPIIEAYGSPNCFPFVRNSKPNICSSVDFDFDEVPSWQRQGLRHYVKCLALDAASWYDPHVTYTLLNMYEDTTPQVTSSLTRVSFQTRVYLSGVLLVRPTEEEDSLISNQTRLYLALEPRPTRWIRVVRMVIHRCILSVCRHTYGPRPSN